jgi:hypothetical protein
MMQAQLRPAVDMHKRGLVLALLVALATACGGKKATVSCAEDSECEGGVCFEEQCFAACEGQDDCEAGKTCVSQTSAQGQAATLCVVKGAALASGWSGTTYVAVSRPFRVNLALGESQSFPVRAGQPTDFAETYNAAVVEALAGVEVGLASLRVVPSEVGEFATFTTSAPAVEETPAPLEVTLRVGSMDGVGTVCDDGVPAASVAFPLTKDYQPGDLANLPEVQASPAALGQVNSLKFSACFRVTAPVDGTLTLTHFPLWAELLLQCDAEPLALGGHWSGTYTCGNSCGGTEAGDVALDITQDGPQATYVDEGGASYTGAVCGDKFVFAGGKQGQGPADPGYLEGGVFSLVDQANATKASYWYSGMCGGPCSDHLGR